ncbi:hypothetical protein LGM80_23485 [Burkholderia multivorans]|nr:hypothetical protein [Burkholderia multivorans]
MNVEHNPNAAPSDERAAFALAMVEAGYHEPEPSPFSEDAFKYQRDQDRYIGFQLGRQSRACSANETGTEGVEPMAVPSGWKLVRVNEHFDALIAALERAESKGYLPDSVREEWENFACDENVIAPQPTAQADAREGLTDEQRSTLESLARTSTPYEQEVLRSILATHPGTGD